MKKGKVLIEIFPEIHVTSIDGIPLLYFKFNPYTMQRAVNDLKIWLEARDYKHWQIHSLEYVAFTDADEAKKFLNSYPNFKEHGENT